jgi:hypothetical protein
MDSITTLLLLSMVSGYGDIDEEGYPSWSERDVHLWTNAVRVDPTAFDDDYANASGGGCTSADFDADQLEPRSLLAYSRELNQAGRYHSQDMLDKNYFSHTSADGTSFFDRVSQWYEESGFVGENIAMGYVDGFDVVMHGWMCSEGHRANILLQDYRELGVGVSSGESFYRYFTQDFGGGSADTSMHILMGIHTPQAAVSGDGITFYADYEGPGPDTMEVVLDGLPLSMDLQEGTAQLGLYGTGASLSENRDCHEYFFVATDSELESRFPQTGSYLVGTNCESSQMWVDRQMAISGREDLGPDELRETIRLAGCSSAPRGVGPAGLLLTLLALLRRKTRS